MMMLEVVRTSETSVTVNVTTWRWIPEDFKLHTRSRENLKSHTEMSIFNIAVSVLLNSKG
jgi:hypothetical protein